VSKEILQPKHAIPYESRLAILGALSPKGNSLSSIYWLRSVVQKGSGGKDHLGYDWPQGILQMAVEKLLATDPRDKIFAFCGLALTSMLPDYTMSVSNVYSRFARKAIDQGMSSQVWQYPGVGLVTAEHSTYSLPSWVPNLLSIPQQQNIFLPLFSQEFAANKNLAKGPFYVDDNLYLHCLGYSTGHVLRVFERLPNNQNYVKSIIDELETICHIAIQSFESRR
jgi:hypothetical protein